MCIQDFSDEQLEESDNPFAQVVLVAKTALLEKKIPEEELLELKLLIGNRLRQKGFDDRKKTAILTFLKNYIFFEKTEMNRRLYKKFVGRHQLL